VLDRAHLARTTFGSAELAREVLGLFDAQSERLLEAMRDGDPAAVRRLAHTLKGAALGIGAIEVARAAEAVERAGAEQKAALRQLARAVESVRTVIAAILASPAE